MAEILCRSATRSLQYLENCTRSDIATAIRARMFEVKEVWFNKVSPGETGADMMTKHAAVGVVRYNKKLVGMM